MDPKRFMVALKSHRRFRRLMWHIQALRTLLAVQIDVSHRPQIRLKLVPRTPFKPTMVTRMTAAWTLGRAIR